MSRSIEEIFKQVRSSNDITPDDPLAGVMERVVTLFTTVSATLKHTLPNPVVKEVLTLMEELTRAGMVGLALGEGMSEIRFMCDIGDDLRATNGLILLPTFWPDEAADHLVDAAIDVVYLGSHARDFYNDRMRDGPDITRLRGNAVVADMLHTMKRELRDRLPPMPLWQRRMDTFPGGVSSLPPGVWYESKSFVEGALTPLVAKAEAGHV